MKKSVEKKSVSASRTSTPSRPRPPISLDKDRLQLQFRGLALFSGLFYTNLLFMAWDTGFPCKAKTLMRLKNVLGGSGSWIKENIKKYVNRGSKNAWCLAWFKELPRIVRSGSVPGQERLGSHRRLGEVSSQSAL